jgi:uncharacterized GH25 family protein
MTAGHSSRRAGRRFALWSLGAALLLAVASVWALWPTSAPDAEAEPRPASDAQAGPLTLDAPAGWGDRPTSAVLAEADTSTETPVEPAWSLSPAVSVVYTGRLLDSSGQPLAGAHVWLVPDSVSWSAAHPEADASESADPPLSSCESTTTDADGRFSIATERSRDKPVDPDEGRPYPELLAKRTGLRPARHVCREALDAPPDPAATTAVTVDVGVLTLVSGIAIEGRVVDESLAPLPRVDVTATAPGDFASGDVRQSSAGDSARSLVAAVSASDGRFLLDGVGPSSEQPIHVRLDVVGRDAGKRDVFASLGEVVQLGDVILARGRAIAGRVVDERGQPLAQIPVKLSDEIVEAPDATVHTVDAVLLIVQHDREVAGSLDGRPARYSEALSDAQGRFEIGGLDARTEYAAFAWAPGREPACVVRLVGGGPEITLRLVPRGRLELRLLQALTNRPVTDASVRAFRGMLGEFVSPLEAVELPVQPLADQPGCFVIAEVCPAEIGVLIDSPSRGRSARVIPGLALGAPREERIVELQPCATLGGRVVVEGSSAPLTGVHVMLWPGDRGAGAALLTRPSMETGDSDAFRFEGLSPGKWLIGASAVGGLPDTDKVTLEPGESRLDFVLSLKPAGCFVGRVRSADGHVASGVDVLVKESASSYGVTASASTGPDGRYAVQAPPGYWALDFSQDAAGWSLSTVIEASVAAGEVTTVDATLPAPARLSGLALSAGRPVPKASIAARGRGVELSIESDEYGRFEADVAGCGELGLVARSPRGGISEVTRVIVEPGGSTWADIRFGGRTLTGLVFDAASGSPIAQAGVLVRGVAKTKDKAPDAGRVVTDAEGRFAFDDMSLGDWRVEVGHPDFQASSQAVTLATADPDPSLVFRLDRANVLSGVVRDEDGAPVTTPLVVSAFEVMDSGLTGSAMTAGDGSYRLVDLPAGLYMVFVTPRLASVGHARGRREDYERRARGSAYVSIEAGQDAQLDIELKPQGD